MSCSKEHFQVVEDRKFETKKQGTRFKEKLYVNEMNMKLLRYTYIV